VADTEFLVAFANRRDDYHDWAVGIAEQVSEPLLTCEAVLAETAFHLQDARVTLAMAREGLVQVRFECREHWQALDALAKRYADRKTDLADLCLIRLSKLFPNHPVITTDRDGFAVYRRNKREAIPALFPP